MLFQLSQLVPDTDVARRQQYVVLAVISVLVKAAFTILLVPLLGELFGENPSAAWGWLLAFSVMWALSVKLDASVNRLSAELGFAIMGTVQRRLVAHLGLLPLGWFQAENISTARQALATSGPELASLVGNVVTPLLNATLLPAAIALGLLLVSPLLGVTALVAVGLLWLALQLGMRFEKQAEKTFASANTVLSDRIIEFARTQPVLRANNQTDPSLSAVGNAMTGSYQSLIKLLLAQIPSQILFSFASQFALIALTAVSIGLTVNGTISAPQCIALIVVIIRFLEPFSVLGNLSVAITGSRRTLTSIHGMLDAPVLAQQGNGEASLPQFETPAPLSVEFSGVSFTYPNTRRAVLDDVSFHVPAGKTVAIVGPSGSGKSTLLSLLTRFFDVDSGSVRVGGIDVRHIPPQTHIAQMSAIWQDVFLFEGTIRDNIVIGAGRDVADSELERVAHISGVDEIVSRLPQGWNTRVGEGGSALSGGEKQRVSVARALLKPAPILLVDEATSALDNKNQNIVARSIMQEAGNRTVLIVAHQVSTIRDADYIVFLDNGRVLEQGTIDELVALDGRFARYWQQRQDSAHWQVK